MLKGLDNHLRDLQVITSPVIRSSYKKVKDICGKSLFSHNGSNLTKDVYVGTIPIHGIQMAVELWRVYWTLKRLLYGTINNTLIIYALHSPFLLAVVMLRKRIGCSCVVVPDLPEYMSRQDSFAKILGKKVDRAIINFCLKRIDCFVLLSPFMRDKLPMKDKPWVLMEGIFDTATISEGIAKRDERVILYCGNLSLKYGIGDLLEAFSGINKDNYRLWICGRGDGEAEIARRVKNDKRITYYGVVNHSDVLALQQQATVLVNPRNSLGEYTKYSFPSKTMEYMASGTPTIMCHLPAIPKEYDDYLFYIEDETVNGIRRKIIEVCEKPQQELDSFGNRASDFIKSQKNAYIQTQKVVKMINSISVKPE